MIQKSMPQSTCFPTDGLPVNPPRTARAMARNPCGHFQVFWLKRHRLIRLPDANAPVAFDIRLFYIQQRHCTGFSPVSLSMIYFTCVLYLFLREKSIPVGFFLEMEFTFMIIFFLEIMWNFMIYIIRSQNSIKVVLFLKTQQKNDMIEPVTDH